jgi:hypothetical protein
MEIMELIPQKTESLINTGEQEFKKSVFKHVQDAVFAAENAFFCINSDFMKHKIKLFMCSKTLLEAEEAIERQYKLAMLGDAKCAENVQSGMQYWLKLVLREIKRLRENAA